MAKSSDEAIYLFCFVHSGRLPAGAGTGVSGRNPLFLHTCRGITAVVSTVSLGDFTGPEAEARLQDLEWIGPRALHHEQVIEEVIRTAPVFPARFGTLFSSFENLDALLERHHDTIEAFLERVAHKQEWSIKGFLDWPKAREESFATLLAAQHERLSASPGTRYLQEQRIRAGVDKELSRWVEETCARAKEELSRHAADRVERKVLPRGAAATDDEMVSNWAFLVHEAMLADFMRLVEQTNTQTAMRGLTFQVSGPWPPYSFTPPLDLEPSG